MSSLSPPPASVRPVGAEWISIPQSRGLSCTPAIICRASRACMALCIRVVVPSALKPSAFPIHRTIRISPPSYYVKETFINRHVFINSVRNHENRIILCLGCLLAFLQLRAQANTNQQHLCNPNSFSIVLLGDPQNYVKYDYNQPVLS